MADENNEDDSWLYGSSNENQENQDEDEQSTLNEKLATPSNQSDSTGDNNKNESDKDNVKTSKKIDFCFYFSKFIHLIFFCRKMMKTSLIVVAKILRIVQVIQMV